MPIVIRPRVADGPLVRLGDGAFEGLEGRHRRGTRFDRKAPVELGKVERGILIAVRSAVLEVNLVGTRRVVARAIERAHELINAYEEDGLRNAFVATAPQDDGWMVAEALDGVRDIFQIQLRVLCFDVVVLR